MFTVRLHRTRSIVDRIFSIRCSSGSSRAVSALLLCASHCQTSITCHPAASSAARFSASRSRFRASFGSQYPGRLFGGRALLHPWACQKQPWTKIAVRRRGRTISGVPGKSRRWRRKRYPARWSHRRTFNSGDVSFGPMRDISALRLSGVRLSAMLNGTKGAAGLQQGCSAIFRLRSKVDAPSVRQAAGHCAQLVAHAAGIGFQGVDRHIGCLAQHGTYVIGDCSCRPLPPAAAPLPRAV